MARRNRLWASNPDIQGSAIGKIMQLKSPQFKKPQGGTGLNGRRNNNGGERERSGGDSFEKKLDPNVNEIVS